MGIDRFFDLRARGTTWRIEVIGGATTFVTLSYIIVVQPAVLATAGMDAGAVLTATCLASAFATALMGLWANYPIAVAPAMGHNFYFALIVAGPVAAGGLGYSWQVALGANCIAGVCFLVLSLVGVRERLIDAIPESLKHAIAAGIGLLIALVGFEWAGLVRPAPGGMGELRLDSAQIGGDDLEAAVAAYTVLLGVEPVVREGRVRRFQLARGAVEIEPGAPGLHAVRFAVADANPLPPARNVNGIEVRFARAAEISPLAAPGGAPVEAIDHVVVRSSDLDRAIAFWRDEIGLRLALDRAFSERGLRLAFFRSGGITLEYAGGHPPPAERDGPDQYHGLSYRLGDLSAHRDRLVRAGLDVSPIRPGMRPGTSVATVRSGTAGVPTLLLQVHGPTA